MSFQLIDELNTQASVLALSRYSQVVDRCPLLEVKADIALTGIHFPLMTQSGHSTTSGGATLKRRPQFKCGDTEGNVNRN
jgi:hypothetical protein